jgi:hypothetical protein
MSILNHLIAGNDLEIAMVQLVDRAIELLLGLIFVMGSNDSCSAPLCITEVDVDVQDLEGFHAHGDATLLAEPDNSAATLSIGLGIESSGYQGYSVVDSYTNPYTHHSLTHPHASPANIPAPHAAQHKLYGESGVS